MGALPGAFQNVLFPRAESGEGGTSRDPAVKARNRPFCAPCVQSLVDPQTTNDGATSCLLI